MQRFLHCTFISVFIGCMAFLASACTSPVAQTPMLHAQKLRELLDPSPTKRLQAQRHFRRRGAQALPWLRRALQTPNAALHLAVLPLLQKLGPAALPAAPELFLLAHKSKGPLRTQAIQTLRSIGPQLLPSLQAIAKDETLPIHHRTLSLFILGSLGAPAWPSTPMLIEIVREEADLRLRNAAIFALGRIGPLAQQALPTLLETLKIRRLAGQSIEAIARMGPIILPTVRELLHSPSSDLRRRAVKIAGKLGSLAFPFRIRLIALLNDPHESTRQASAKTLHRIGPRTLPALRIALQEGHWRQRANAAYTLGLFGPKALPALSDLIRATLASTWQIRRTSAWALGKIGPQAHSAAPALFALLYDPSFQVRQHALRSLPKLKLAPTTLQPPLERFLHNTKDPEDLLSAARLLSATTTQSSHFFAWKKLLHIAQKERHVFFALRALHHHPNRLASILPDITAALDRFGTRRVQAQITQILRTLGPLALPAVLSILRGQHHRIQMRTIRIIGRLPHLSQNWLPELLDLAQNAPFTISRQSLFSLGRLQINAPSVIALLRQTLHSTDFRYRAIATQAIELMGANALPLLQDLFEATRDIHWEVRQDAVRILGKILPHNTLHEKNVQDRLQQALTDEDFLVRNEALKSLLLRRPSRTLLLALLHKHLRDPSPVVQKTAALALRALDPKQDPQALLRAYHRAQRFLMRKAIPTKQQPLAAFLDHAPAHQKLDRWNEIEEHAPHNLSLLAYALTHSNRSVQDKAIQDLQTRGNSVSSLFPHIIQLMGEPRTDSSLQQKLIALLQQDLPKALIHLQRALHSPNARIAREACATLAQIPQHATPLVPNLIFALRRRHAWHEARRALIQQKARALPDLLRAIEHPHLLIRARVIEILSFQPQALLPLLPRLRKALQHSFTQLRWKATEALTRLGPAALPALDDLIQLLEDRNAFVRWRAARAIGVLGPPAAKAIPALLQQLDAPDPQLKQAARIALKKLGGPQDIEQLRRSLSHKNPNIRAYAARILSQIQEDAAPAIPDLQRAFRDASPRVRHLALRAYAQAVTPSTAALSRLLDATLQAPDPSHPAYTHALLLLLQRAPSLLDTLQPLRSSPERPLRQIVLQVFAQLQSPTSQPTSRAAFPIQPTSRSAVPIYPTSRAAFPIQPTTRSVRQPASRLSTP